MNEMRVEARGTEARRTRSNREEARERDEMYVHEDGKRETEVCVVKCRVVRRIRRSGR